ncbi:MAG TPA: alcohol dehydrogenase catalytic domain-containing protein [Spirochaetota bacterium]|nr:alcohol dehydrogenase catalytic domain-containing protein [Spirochaetota bacterium]
MKEVVLTGIRRMSMQETEIPAITRDTDVLIKIKAIGICGSDVHYYTTGRIGSQVVKYPFRVGHEGSGIITATGAGVTGLQKGDRVAIDPAMPCYQCEQCRAGRTHTCRHLKFLGCPGQARGLMAEYITMPAASCYKVPDTLNFDQAVLSEPLSIGTYAVKYVDNLPQRKCAVLGLGPIGLSVMHCLLAANTKRIYGTDKIQARLDFAGSQGIHWCANPQQTDIVKDITKAEPAQVDAVFECCGDQEALDQAVEILKPGGKLLLIGIPRTERISFIIDKLRRKEICVQNIRRQNECVTDALTLLTEKKDIDRMITHHFQLDSSAAGFELVAEYADGVVKAMLHL